MFYVYVLVQQYTGHHYVGYSRDLKRRVAEHCEGRGAKITRSPQWRLVYYEAFAAEEDARRREAKLKQHGNARRELLRRIEASICWAKSGAGEACDRSTGKRRP